MYACIYETWTGFFGGACTPSNATANSHDPPPPPITNVPEPRCQGSGPKWITRRVSVGGDLA